MKQTAGNITAFIIMCFMIKAFPKTVLTVIGVIVLVFIIICAIGLSMEYFRKKRIECFMNENHNKYFLSYSSNKKLKPTIETELKSLFNFDYEVIYNNRNVIESTLDQKIIDYLQNQSIGLKLPILYKVTKEKVLVNSFYEETYEMKENYISKDIFKTRVNNKLNKQS